MMAAADRDFTVRRIVVAIDGSVHGRAAIEAAANLGAQLHAEVEGVFVEDINLVHLSELKLGRETQSISGRMRDLDPEALARDLRAEAARARRALEVQAGRARVTCSFRVVRGRVETEVIAAAGDADLLVLGAVGRSAGPGRRPGSTALAAARHAPRSVLLLHPDASMAGNPMVAYDGSEGSELALDAACRLVAGRGGTIAVLVIASEGDAKPLRQRVESRLEPHGVTPVFSRIDKPDLDEMCRLSHQARASILVLSADHPLLADRGHRALIERIGCPVLLVR